MTFAQAMKWLEEEHRFPEDPADFHERRFRDLAERSSLFKDPMPRLVVVTGSCGKASTARFLAFMLRAAGLKVGLGTKPPLSESAQGNLERYQLLDDKGEHWLDPQLFARICEPLPRLVKDIPAELGEIAPYDMRTWVLLRAFQEWNVDIGIVEANIGLRHDPAGAIPNAELTIITPIATDHAGMLKPAPEWAHLGDAAGPLWHKLSAVPSKQVVVGRQPSISPSDLDRLLRSAARPSSQINGARPNAPGESDGQMTEPSAVPGPRWDRDFTVDEVRSGLWGSSGLLRYEGQELPLQLSCLGDFQLGNAATAAVAARQLGIDDDASLLAGARDCQIPGRLQVMDRDPLQLLCVASSQTKVQAMLESLEPLFEMPEAGMVMVLSLLDRVHGKEDVISYIAGHPRLKALVVTECEYPDESRDLPPQEVAAIARQAHPALKVVTESRPGAAITQGRALAKDQLLLLLGNGLASFASQPQRSNA